MPEFVQQTLFDMVDAPALPKSVALKDAIEILASDDNKKTRGAIFTRIEVVEFILDLVGYIDSKPLHTQRILEPCFGEGDFLLPIVARLLSSWQKNGGNTELAFYELSDSLRAVELHRETYNSTRKVVVKQLEAANIAFPAANKLADKWLIQGDFLLEQQNSCFHYIVGNPPYVRQDLIPATLLSEYRRRFKTMYDRADLYIPFIENSLSLIDNEGVLGFICADRWMKNRYGGPLRELISREFHLKFYIDMVNTEAFQSKVSAYPAITVIAKSTKGPTRFAYQPKIDKKSLASISAEILSDHLCKESPVREIAGVVNSSEPWLLESLDQVALIRRIENQFPPIEQTGCKVGIGVATGADKAFIGDFELLDIEPDRKLPLVATRDIQSGEVHWLGKGVINPFADDGSLVDLNAYPRLNRYLEKYKKVIASRHCAQKVPANWYRTIDRIWPNLTHEPKLLIPDIKGESHIVFESGKLYPHHNLYFVTSSSWNLRALQAVLLSSLTKIFVETYSTRIRGGYMRFQAQYLRRIRIPLWQDVSENLRQELIHAACIRDLNACNNAVFKLYKLNHEERATIGRNGE